MHIDNLTKAVTLKEELQRWNDAEERTKTGVFQDATLRIASAGHGHNGQTAETLIRLVPDNLFRFIAENKARLVAELRELGVSF